MVIRVAWRGKAERSEAAENLALNGGRSEAAPDGVSGSFPVAAQPRLRLISGIDPRKRMRGKPRSSAG
jgi:hypothetical protein